MAVILTEALRIEAAAKAFDMMVPGKSYSADDMKALRAQAEFELAGGEEVIADPIPENTAPAVGDRIIQFDDLLALPVGTLLVGDKGESYRIGTKEWTTDLAVYTQSPSGRTNVDLADGIVKGGSFAEGNRVIIVWLP